MNGKWFWFNGLAQFSQLCSINWLIKWQNKQPQWLCTIRIFIRWKCSIHVLISHWIAFQVHWGFYLIEMASFCCYILTYITIGSCSWAEKICWFKRIYRILNFTCQLIFFYAAFGRSNRTRIQKPIYTRDEQIKLTTKQNLYVKQIAEADEFQLPGPGKFIAC